MTETMAPTVSSNGEVITAGELRVVVTALTPEAASVGVNFGGQLATFVVANKNLAQSAAYTARVVRDAVARALRGATGDTLQHFGAALLEGGFEVTGDGQLRLA